MERGSVPAELDVIARCEAKVEAREMYLKEHKPKNLASHEEKAMSKQVLPRQSLPGQRVIQIEYDRSGRVIECQVKFEKSNCTGAAGIEAADAATNLLKSNIACKEDSEDVIAPKEEKQVATWTIKIPDGSVLDRLTFAEALLRASPEDLDAYAVKTYYQ